MGKKMVLLAFLALLAPPALAAETQERPGISVEKLLAAMDGVERDYYYQSFDYAMEALKVDEKFEWESYDSKGYFQTGQPFVRNDTVCRNFRELITHKKMYSLSSEGIGCKRLGKAGWCKLRKDDMRTCAMEPPQGPVEEVQNAVDEAARKAGRAEVQGKSWWNSLWPF